ncbi:MAG TPA: hypothetical protein VNI81_10235 [Candidatus Limnocylindrales bacterium]|jgi:hypothetical protein|nr:hypothetical protein [Candidatus Limnocylindrales bacterium]
MRRWKMEHRFDWGLTIQISLLILVTMVVFCLLIYNSYTYTR